MISGHKSGTSTSLVALGAASSVDVKAKKMINAKTKSALG